MIKRLLLGIALLNLISTNAQSPITLSNSNMPGANDTLRYTNVQINSIGNYTQTGTNYNWDFSNVVSTTSARRDFKSSFQTPYAFYFLSLNEYGEKIADTLVGGTSTITITNFYNFYKKQTTPVNAFIADGVGMTISGIPAPSYYSDKDELYKFPMTYPKNDTTTFKFSTLTTTLLPIKYSKAGTRVTIVDGWGTIKTPFGTDNCLRLMTTQYSIDTISINLPIPGFPPIKFGTPNNQRSYQWISTTSKIPYFEVTGSLTNTNFTPNTIRYKGINMSAPPPPPPPPPPNLVGIKEVQDISALELYPNPVKDKLWISGAAQLPSKAEVYDVNGKLVLTQALSTIAEVSFIDISNLQTGLYVVRICSDGKNVVMKVVKE